MTSAILAIDPGPTLSAWVEIAGAQVLGFGHDPTPSVERRARMTTAFLAIERIESYGLAVGAEVFETCFAIGRMDPERTALLVPRLKVKLHLCHSPNAKDGNVRQALIDRWGGERARGNKKSPGPLYGVSGDVWQALALAVYVSDNWL